MIYSDTNPNSINRSVDVEAQVKKILNEINPYYDAPIGMKKYRVPWGEFTAYLADIRGDILVFENARKQKFYIKANLIEEMVPLPTKAEVG